MWRWGGYRKLFQKCLTSFMDDPFFLLKLKRLKSQNKSKFVLPRWTDLMCLFRVPDWVNVFPQSTSKLTNTLRQRFSTWGTRNIIWYACSSVLSLTSLTDLWKMFLPEHVNPFWPRWTVRTCRLRCEAVEKLLPHSSQSPGIQMHQQFFLRKLGRFKNFLDDLIRIKY